MEEHSILFWSDKKSSWCCCIFKGIFRGHDENNDTDTKNKFKRNPINVKFK